MGTPPAPRIFLCPPCAPVSTDTTTLLRLATDGDPLAERRFVPHVYGELRRIAQAHLSRERSDHTLQATGLVHEAYAKLVGGKEIRWEDHQHFVAVASRAMRQILVDHARRRNRQKGPGRTVHVPLDPDRIGAAALEPGHVLALDQALTALDRYDPRLGRLVELRFFGGMTMPEAAAELAVSLRAAERAWTRARLFLLAALDGDLVEAA